MALQGSHREDREARGRRSMSYQRKGGAHPGQYSSSSWGKMKKVAVATVGRKALGCGDDDDSSSMPSEEKRTRKRKAIIKIEPKKISSSSEI